MQTNFPRRSQGAEVLGEGGVRYRTWVPGRPVGVVIGDANGGAQRELSLGEEKGGYWTGIDPQGRAGDRYRYRFDGKEWPDPASRFNPDGVHGAAQVIDPREYEWSDHSWTASPLSELVIYELHVGTFTPNGTFRGAIEKLDHVAELGATALELMPVADFPGGRNWGYDGVSLYAPARVYGRPDDLRALVDAAHARGLTVILDVVYNHLGPDGNYLGAYSRDYFNPRQKTPWGDGFNFELQPVRDFFLENIGYWRSEFHIDGFRLDATHAIEDKSAEHILAEISERAQSLGAFVIAEDERNEAMLLRRRPEGGMGLDGIWSDDFHHVVRVMLTGTREGYYAPYQGTADELSTTIDHGWLFAGKKRARQALYQRGEEDRFEPFRFVFCITNHDQIGNQAFGVRLNQFVSDAAFRAASALLCLVPYTPLLLMGQEWAASAPFQFFTDHEAELGRKVTEGRREEFRSFAAFRDPAARAKIPDPQAEETFLRSKLNWNELKAERHAGVLRLYRELLGLRRSSAVLRDRSRENFAVLEPIEDCVRLLYGKEPMERWLILATLTGRGGFAPGEGWELVLSTNEGRFGGGDPAVAQPELRIYRSPGNSR